MEAGDRELLLRISRGDREAGEALWRSHASRLRAYARALLRREADADDLVQSLFCKLLSLRPEQIAAVADVAAFLTSSLRNAAANAMRSGRRERRRKDRWRQRHRSGADSAPGRQAAADGIWHACEGLPRRLREVVVLRHVCGMSFDQISLAIGVPRSTAASRHATALRMIERAMAPATAPVVSGGAR